LLIIIVIICLTQNLAGNYGEDACKYSPGSTPGAITVGAIDKDDSVSYYSNFGKCVDM
jgi:cerevisin